MAFSSTWWDHYQNEIFTHVKVQTLLCMPENKAKAAIFSNDIHVGNLDNPIVWFDEIVIKMQNSRILNTKTSYMPEKSKTSDLLKRNSHCQSR